MVSVITPATSMSRLAYWAAPKNSGEVASTVADQNASARPWNLRASHQTEPTASAAPNIDASRPASRPVPNRLTASPSIQKNSGGLCWNGMPARRGTTQSPLAGIQRAISR